MKTEGEIIRDLRTKLGFTQAECAKIFSVTTTTWYMWEKGRTKIKSFLFKSIITKFENIKKGIGL